MLFFPGRKPVSTRSLFNSLFFFVVCDSQSRQVFVSALSLKASKSQSAFAERSGATYASDLEALPGVIFSDFLDYDALVRLGRASMEQRQDPSLEKCLAERRTAAAQWRIARFSTQCGYHQLAWLPSTSRQDRKDRVVTAVF